jgi:soluble lytic murein transglycosylase-like protein
MLPPWFGASHRMRNIQRLAIALLLVLSAVTPSLLEAQGAGARLGKAKHALNRAAEERQTRRATERFDPIFKKYTKRYFGIGTDWRWFKAQGMAESDLTPGARSRVGARGIMQLMPSTYGQIRSAIPSFGAIDNPEWNIAAGILHDRDLWTLYTTDVDEVERWHFVFAGYNAGEGTINRARRAALAAKLDNRTWPNIERVAPKVERWRYAETLDYVKRIRANKDSLAPR